MTFTSISFAIFFLVLLPVYWAIGDRRRQNLLLLATSYLFYGWWDYRFCGLLLLSSLIDYAAGRLLAVTEAPGRRRALLVVSLVSNLGLLATFKYFDFFAEGLRDLARSFGVEVSPFTLRLVLPIGISFYTFQSLNYTIDVYRRQLVPSRSLVDFLTFVSYFPHLVAGPINRATDLLRQVAAPRRFDIEQAVDGCRQMLWGALKKIVIADNLALIVEPAYADPAAQSGPVLVAATMCFALQIYCDFSGYSDIAIGCSNVFGIRLMRNFAYPYFSRSLAEFWRRWHISLSTWFRDYVYVPLGGSRGSLTHQGWVLMVTFTLSGVWHGAAWHFVVWGALNGVGLMVERLWFGRGRIAAPEDPPGLGPSPMRGALGMASTFAVVCLGWIFFRAASIPDALLIVETILRDSYSRQAWAPLGTLLAPHTNALAAAAALLCVEWIQRSHAHPLTFDAEPRRWRAVDWAMPTLRWTVYTTLIMAILQFGPFRTREFIYFQF